MAPSAMTVLRLIMHFGTRLRNNSFQAFCNYRDVVVIVMRKNNIR